MNDHEPPSGGQPATSRNLCESSSWSARYGEKHRLCRVTTFPPDIIPPEKVRLYLRNRHYVLQWWDPTAKRNLSDRVDGDLVSAITRARQLEERIAHFRSGSRGVRRLSHDDLVERFLTDLRCRADAGTIDPGTVGRYSSALAHYRAFCGQPLVQRSYPHAAGVNRDFRLAFSAFLAGRSVSPNGSPLAVPRPMKGQAFILDTVRAMLEWAGDPDRGNLLHDDFRNPFLRHGETRSLFRGDPLGEPDITLSMALELVCACDLYQLLLFAPLLLFGLRASEPCYLFREYLDHDWLRVPCNLDLGYRTKGRRDKRFPLPDELKPLWDALRKGCDAGLLYLRRAVRNGREPALLRGRSLADLVAEYQRRCAATKVFDAVARERIRDAVLYDAGGLRYDHVEQEFGTLARRLGWPAAASLKDLRHLFATTLGNTAMPEGYRRYLMGHAPGKAAVVAYSHLNELRRHYVEAVRREWTPLLDSINLRLREVGAGLPA
jgi:hypothetical protein